MTGRRGARFVREALLFHLAWRHRGPFPRRSRAQRREDTDRAYATISEEVTRIEELIVLGLRDESYDCEWRPRA